MKRLSVDPQNKNALCGYRDQILVQGQSSKTIYGLIGPTINHYMSYKT